MHLRLVSKISAVISVVGLLVTPGGSEAADPVGKDRQFLESITHQIHDVFEHCRDAVVKITAQDRHGKLSGTGFFIDPVGTIYTSYSIGGEAREIIVEVGGKKYAAQRLMADPRSGVAILKIEAETPFLQIGSSHDLEAADPLVAIGYPMDLTLSPSFGAIAGFDRRYMGRYFPTSHIRVNIPVQRGQGGSPLLNLNNEVVGILVSGVDGGAVCYGLPIDAAEKVRNDFIRFGEVRHGWMGLTVAESVTGTSGSAVVVEKLAELGPARKAGVQVGDVLLRVGNVDVRVPDDVLDASFFLTAGDTVVVVVERDGKRVSLQSNPANRRSLHAHTRRIPKASVSLESTVEHP